MATVNDKAAWLAERRTGLGGSDIAKIMGASIWGSGVDVYLDKKGLAEPIQENMSMKLGTALEPFVAEQFMEATGKRVIEYRPTIHGTGENSFALGNLDRVVVEPGQDIDEMVAKLSVGDLSCVEAILECKTSSAHDAWVDEETGTPRVPAYYMFQVLHYMGLVPTCKRVYVCVVFLGKFKDRELFCIERDDEKIEKLFEIERAWWQKHIVEDVMPEPQTKEEVIELYPRSNPLIQCNLVGEKAQEVTDAIATYKQAKADKADAESRLEEAEGVISRFIGESESLVDADGKVCYATFKTGNDTVKDVVDWEAVAKEMGATEDVIRAHTEFGKITRRGSRPLRVFDSPKELKAPKTKKVA